MGPNHIRLIYARFCAVAIPDGAGLVDAFRLTQMPEEEIASVTCQAIEWAQDAIRLARVLLNLPEAEEEVVAGRILEALNRKTRPP